MTFYEVLEQVLVLLQRHGRVTYRALKREQYPWVDEVHKDANQQPFPTSTPRFRSSFGMRSTIPPSRRKASTTVSISVTTSARCRASASGYPA